MSSLTSESNKKCVILLEDSTQFATSTAENLQKVDEKTEKARKNINKLKNVFLAVVRFAKKCKPEESKVDVSNSFDEKSVIKLSSMRLDIVLNGKNSISKRSFSEAEISKNSLESMTRSVILLQESEQFANATAHNFFVQGEKLVTIDEKLNQIHEKTKQSRKNLNKLKNVFWALILFSRKSDKNKNNNDENKMDKSENQMGETVKKFSSTNLMKASDIQSTVQRSFSDSKTCLPRHLRLDHMSVGSKNSSIEEQIDEHFDVISLQLNRLRDISFSMSIELEDQNNLLDKIADKVDKSDTEIRSQMKDIKKYF